MKRSMLVTGAGGLVGSAVVRHFCERDWLVFGIENDARATFFGPDGSTMANVEEMLSRFGNFDCYTSSILSPEAVERTVSSVRPDAIVHAAAQPSHDKAADIPLLDFDTNARATLLLLEAARRICPEAPFIFTSTNKVYGDSPNAYRRVELDTRYDWPHDTGSEGSQGEIGGNGWSEDWGIDASMHSLFGCSKAAADLYVQEYGRYFGMKTVCLRAGCITGAAHAAVPLHGFLAYLAKCVVTGTPYKVFGYKGKQVRDNIHADDLAAFCEQFIENPRSAAVYNIGGGYGNSCSVVEAARDIGEACGRKAILDFGSPYPARKGDHIVYYSDLSRIRMDYPGWKITKSLTTIFTELIESWTRRASSVA